MPTTPLPDELKAFLAEANPSVIATVTPEGEPHSAATWYLWEDGRVLVRTPRSAHAVELGQLDLVRFVAPAGLEAMGDGLFRATESAGTPIVGRAGRDGMGAVPRAHQREGDVAPAPGAVPGTMHEDEIGHGLLFSRKGFR